MREEIAGIDLSSYAATASRLLSHLEGEIGSLYKTRCPVTGKLDAEAKYFIWVKTGICASCDRSIDLFPGYILAQDVRHPAHVLVCPSCGDLNEVIDLARPGSCGCGEALVVEGPVRRNKCVCPHCSHVNNAPFHGEGPPSHRMFAIEYHNPDLTDRPGRLFKKPDADDLERFAKAHDCWTGTKPSFVPDDPIPEGDETNRLHRWGYRHFCELFNSRQLLALEKSARFISEIEDRRLRRALATNFSDLLRYQNMLCRYDTMALKSLDVFSIHGFPVSYVQAESNILGIRNGNGLPVGSSGWINIIEKYTKAKRYCAEPFEVVFEGKKKKIVPITGEWIGEGTRNVRTYPPSPLPDAGRGSRTCLSCGDSPLPVSGRGAGGVRSELGRGESRGRFSRRVDLRCGSAVTLDLPAASLDAVFTDPPYYGMVQYGELMHFCYVWLRKLMGRDFPGLEQETTRHIDELTGNDTAERGLAHFAEGLAKVYSKMATALKPGAPLAFTFHHNQQEAYLAAAMAILDAGLTCSASLPCPAEMGGSIHIHGTDSSIVDTVFVCRHRDTTPRAWLFENASQFATIVAHDLAELREAGMKPTAGDIRCIAFGHITRMAIWNLQPHWKANRPTEQKLNEIRSAMDSLADVDDV